VLCLDGYQDAVLRFADACSQVRLQAGVAVEFASAPETLPFDQVFEGERILEQRMPQRIIVAVRNTSGIAAKNMAVEFNIPFVSRSAPASGPGEISAFGTEEYVLALNELVDPRDAFRLAQSKIKITCDNCLQVRVKKD
jgi:hypothetical protein